MLLEHALLASGDVAEGGAIYAGWPARQLEQRRDSDATVVGDGNGAHGEKGGKAESQGKITLEHRRGSEVTVAGDDENEKGKAKGVERKFSEV